jgi:hypothetical protein
MYFTFFWTNEQKVSEKSETFLTPVKAKLLLGPIFWEKHKTLLMYR